MWYKTLEEVEDSLRCTCQGEISIDSHEIALGHCMVCEKVYSVIFSKSFQPKSNHEWENEGEYLYNAVMSDYPSICLCGDQVMTVLIIDPTLEDSKYHGEEFQGKGFITFECATKDCSVSHKRSSV